MKKILVITRFDSNEKPGGDVNLMKAFLIELNRNYSCEHYIGIPNIDKLVNYDAVFCCNIDRPIEPYNCLLLCRQLGIHFVLYTLHHPYDGIRSYMRYGLSGSKRILAALAFNDPAIYENYLWLAKVVLNYKKRLPLGNVKIAQRQLLAKSDLIITCNKKELTQINKDLFSVNVKAAHVKHSIVNYSMELNKTTIVKNRIIVPGRLESRKNQILIRDIIDYFPECEFIFVGAQSPNDKRYVQKLINFIDSYENCQLMQAMTEIEFYEFLATADVVFTASWFEVTSLIELQAISLGLKLVCTENSYIDKAPNVYKFNPEKTQTAVDSLGIALSNKNNKFDSASYTNNENNILEIMEMIF